MSKKQDKAIIKGFKLGGASDISLEKVGSGYRRAFMVVSGKRVQVQKIPSSSHLDERGCERKARDYAKRFVKYDADKLVW